jgi:hypothetical protein
MNNDRLDAFISFTGSDLKIALELTSRLQQAGRKASYAATDSASWDKSLDSIIRSARFLLIVISPDYLQSPQANDILEKASSPELERGGTKVIPVLLRDCEMPPLRSEVFADFRSEGARRSSFSGLIYAVKKGGLDRLPRISELGGSPSVPAACAPAAPGQTPADRELCFVVMPFGSELDDIYEKIVKRAITECGLRCKRSDDMFGSVVMDDIRKSIKNARLVVAELTGRNPNVLYEVGFAHALNKDVLLLTQSKDDVPFDLRHWRVLEYKCDVIGGVTLASSIREMVNAILKGED